MFAALKSLVGGAEAALPYVRGDSLGICGSLVPWTLANGSSKDGTAVSIFSLERKTASEAQVQAALNAVKRFKTLRHPNFVRYIDSLESDAVISIVTEAVTPLPKALEEDRNAQGITWGVHQIAKALQFLGDASMVHQNVCLDAVFVDTGGEWKLGGLELLRTKSDAALALQPQPAYMPPEYLQGGGGAVSATSLDDIWRFGCFIWEIFHGKLRDPAQLKTVAKIPKPLLPHYVTLVSANPKSRPSPQQFLQRAESYFQNDLVYACEFLAELTLQDEGKKATFFSKLPEMMDSFPKATCLKKIFPQLLNAFNFGGAGTAILAPMFKIGNLMTAEEYQKQIVPALVKLFSSTDRATRINLLQQLETFHDFLTADVVTKEIFPQIVNGFTDTVPQMREQTVKAMLFLAGKLSQDVLENQMLRFFAKLQADEKAEIRTNTTICLGKIAVHLSPAARAKVLIPAFLRATKDTFLPARLSGLAAFGATIKYYCPEEVATRILPALLPLTIDPEVKIREQVFSLSKVMLGRLERASKGEEVTMTAQDKAAVQGFATSNWVGWAVGGISSKLLKGGDTATATDIKRKEPTIPMPAPVVVVSGPVVPAPRLDEDEDEDEEEEAEDDEWHDTSSLPKLPLQSNKGGLNLRAQAPAKTVSKKSLDGWDDDGWGDLEEPSPMSSRTPSSSGASSSRSALSPAKLVAPRTAASPAKQKVPAKEEVCASDWTDDGWDALEESSAASPITAATTTASEATSGWEDDGWADDDNAESPASRRRRERKEAAASRLAVRKRSGK